jgi:hypothetical protein
VEDENSWHLDKKVPITLIGAIVLQTFCFGYWAATLTTRVGYLESNAPSAIAEFAKLELARENSNLALQQLQSDVKILQGDATTLLDLARKNENRNTIKDQADK